VRKETLFINRIENRLFTDRQKFKRGSSKDISNPVRFYGNEGVN
jgi:hypothetical protein